MATEDISLRIKLDDVAKALRTIPTLTEKEFREVEKKAGKSLRQIGKDAEKAIKDAEKAAEKAQAALEKAAEEQMQAVGKVGDMFTGGLVGDLEDVGKAFGPIGAAAIGAAGGIAVTVGAVVALGDGILAIKDKAIDTIARLEELGLAETVTEQQREAVKRAEGAFEAMDLAIGKVAINITENFVPDIEQAARFVENLSGKLQILIDRFDGLSIIEELAVSFGVVLSQFEQLSFWVEITAKTWGALNEAVSGNRTAVGEWGYAQIEARKALIATTTGIDRQRDSVENLSDADLALQGNIDKVTAALAKEKEEGKKNTQEKDEHRAKLEAEREARKAAAAAAKEHAEAVKRAAEEERKAKEALDAQKQSLDDLTQMFSGYVRAIEDRNTRALSEQDKIVASYDAELKKISSLVEKAKELATTQEAYDAAVARGNVLRSAATDEYLAKLEDLDRKIAESNKSQTEQTQATAETATGIWRDYYDEIGKLLSEQLDKFEATYGLIVKSIGQIGSSYEELSRQRLDLIMDERAALLEAIQTQTGAERAASVERLKATREEANAQREALARGFRLAQAAAVAAAIVDAARSAIALMPAFAALGPYAPVAAAGVAGTALAIQLATIRAQQPRFHSGLDPSETPAILTRGEGVANARAMAQPGFSEALRVANAGLPVPSQAPVVIALNDRVLAQLDARTRRIRGRDYGSRTMVRLGSANHYMGG